MKYIPSGVTRLVGHAVLLGQKNSPSILFGAGLIGVVATTVLASKATLHLEETVEEAQDQIDRVKQHNAPGYTDTKRQRDLTVVYTRSVMEVGKLYAPALVVGAISVACLTKSHNILTSRNAALTTAYNGLLTAFQTYRKRVVEDVGEEKDMEYLYGIDQRQIVEETAKGQKITTLNTFGDGRGSPYAVVFDRNNRNWNNNADYNLQFIRSQQRYLTDLLNSRGHVMLNEAYDALGFNHTPAGSQVGWLRDRDGGIDGYVDFGIFKDNRMQDLHEFLTGREGSILLDFNVDGVIWDKIGKQKRMPVPPWRGNE